MQIYQNLQKLRKINKLTQQEVAEYLEIKPNTYGAWEANKTSPSAYYLPKLAKLFKVTINDLFEFNDAFLPLPPLEMIWLYA